MTKLNWVYDDESGEQRAMYNGYRIRAVRDDDAQNPFTEEDDHFPMVVYHDRNFTHYCHDREAALRYPLMRFTDEQLWLQQKHIDKLLDTDLSWKPLDEMDQLRSVFEEVVSEYSSSATLDEWAELYRLAGLRVCRGTSRGYSQGDWADLLIVATRETMTRFGWTEEQMADEALVDAQLKAQAELYGDWAWGNVYGYIVESFDPAGEPDADPDDDDFWDEIEDGSCGGYFGTDHEASGLEESALACIPDTQERLAA